MYERNDAWNQLPPAQRDSLLKRYGLWVRDLRSKGILKDGNAIGRGGVLIALDAKAVPEAYPLDLTAQSLTGYFIIEVKNAQEAEFIAGTCPALSHGETVHVRPVGH
jgi:hypothetical protein